MKLSVQKLYESFLQRFPQMIPCSEELSAAFETIVGCYAQGGKLLVCGNGGSAADTEHIVGELMKKYLCKRPLRTDLVEKIRALGIDNADYLASHLEQPLMAISLVSQTSLLTAIANDTSADMIFAQQVLGYGKPGDVLLALSTSGNSPNILNAINVARALDMTTIGFTGEGGGAILPLCTITIRVPGSITPDIQELHLPIYHLLCAMVEEEFFGCSS